MVEFYIKLKYNVNVIFSTEDYMTKSEYIDFIKQEFEIFPDYPFSDDTIVFRHSDNKKWFALIMDVPKVKFNCNSNESVTVVNLKCDTLLIGSLVLEEGIFPAYHMNKSHWISVWIDDNTDIEKIKWLAEISFNLTKKSGKKTMKEPLVIFTTRGLIIFLIIKERKPRIVVNFTCFDIKIKVFILIATVNSNTNKI